ncbi:MAG: hypothetical protein HC901_04095 [Bdellovibrionaceae bacterium]|nr:hypothetical protein [Pseudobdellovibrionaceae bacterium]
MANYNNGGNSTSGVVALSGNMAAGSYLYVVFDNGAGSNGFTEFFGGSKTVIEGTGLNINGDDAVALRVAADDSIIDLFGFPNVDGTNQTWEYLDGWAYRNSTFTSASATFVPGNWTYSGIDQLEGGSINDDCISPFPIGTFAGGGSIDGNGRILVRNGTPASDYIDSPIFPRNTTGQTINLILNATISGNLASVRYTLPAAFGTPTLANITLSGAGFSGALASVSGQNITITGANVTQTNNGTLSLGNVTTPNISNITETGAYTVTTMTAGSGGNLTNVSFQPIVSVLVPIENLRDVNGNGTALDLGQRIAVEGVCTANNLNASSVTAYLQDATAGINIFSNSFSASFTRGNRYAVVGTILQFNGLTEVSPTGTIDIVDLGTDTEPAPLVLTIPALLASAEDLEAPWSQWKMSPR